MGRGEGGVEENDSTERSWRGEGEFAAVIGNGTVLWYFVTLRSTVSDPSFALSAPTSL